MNRRLSLTATAWLLAGCSQATPAPTAADVTIPPPTPPTPEPLATAEARPLSSSAPAPSESAEPTARFACKLPAAKKSDDPCTADADCGVSEPCHAKACVARAKSSPPGPDTMCTQNLVCDSADANRCGCYEGRCALIPPP